MRGWIIGLVFVGLTCATGCSSVNVKTDYDSTVDFSRFKTYAFIGLTDLNRGGVLDNSLLRKRLEHMIERELTKKGLTKVGIEEKPDLLVHYWVAVRERQMLTSTGPPIGVMGWRGAYGWGTGYSGLSTYEYEEGTLVTDLIETRSKDLVWRATMVAPLGDSQQENAKLADEAFAKAFDKYPPSKRSP